MNLIQRELTKLAAAAIIVDEMAAASDHQKTASMDKEAISRGLYFQVPTYRRREMNLPQRELVKLAAASIIANDMIRQAQQAAPITKTGSKAGILALLGLLGLGGLGAAGAVASQIPVETSHGSAQPLWQAVRDYNQEPGDRAASRRQTALENAQNRILGALSI